MKQKPRSGSAYVDPAMLRLLGLVVVVVGIAGAFAFHVPVIAHDTAGIGSDVTLIELYADDTGSFPADGPVDGLELSQHVLPCSDGSQVMFKFGGPNRQLLTPQGRPPRTIEEASEMINAAHFSLHCGAELIYKQ